MIVPYRKDIKICGAIFIFEKLTFYPLTLPPNAHAHAHTHLKMSYSLSIP